ncbi:flagellar biosynthetic protein FliQ [Euzebya rosea]|uniref:flagellar biosynthetic protein FliQ n=1 Tax=Euzebya rosea TaxID=2052804 RepID=UPI000D3E1275|nr:flagellar biosynthetic protein FliQ [Euzebya rosea]
MNDVAVLEIGIQAMWVATKVAAPILVMALAIGLFVGLMQSVTQIQEVTLTFVPKFVGIAFVFAVGGNWMLNEIVTFTRVLFESIPSLLG